MQLPGQQIIKSQQTVFCFPFEIPPWGTMEIFAYRGLFVVKQTTLELPRESLPYIHSLSLHSST